MSTLFFLSSSLLPFFPDRVTEIKIVSLGDLVSIPPAGNTCGILAEIRDRARTRGMCTVNMPFGEHTRELRRPSRAGNARWGKKMASVKFYTRQKFTGSLRPAWVSRNRIYLRRKNVTGARMIYKPGSYCLEETHTLLGVVKIDFFLRGR